MRANARFSGQRWGKYDEASFMGKMLPREAFSFCRFPRRHNPAVAGMLEVIDQPYFDSASFAAAAAMAKTIMFQVPVSGAKTEAQTNMTFAGQLPFPQRLVIRTIGYQPANNTAPVDLVNLGQNCSFKLFVGKKPYLECYLGFLTAGRGSVAYSAAQLGTVAAGDVSFASTSQGIPDPRAMVTLPEPVIIESGEAFNSIINPETAFNFAAAAARPAGNGTTIYIVLDGQLSRQVS